MFYRDPLECIQSLLESPLVKDHIRFTPLRLFETAEKLVRVYNDWLTGDTAWRIQVSVFYLPIKYMTLTLLQSKLPPGATLLGTIISSDKTNISAMTGNRIAHPLLISLANFDMEFLMKALHHAFALLALLPIPQFLHRKKEVCSLLEARLTHQCFDYIFEPLKTAARIGIMMSDPLGWSRHCFTPLVSCIIDTPESALYAGVAGKTSSVTTASYKQFGDDFQHPPRTGAYTLKQLRKLRRRVHPWDIVKYLAAAKKLRLNGVHLPFWRNWPGTEVPEVYTPEPLHHWHKEFWDHDAKWCIRILGGAEIDFRFSILHPHSGFRHFKEGISKLKQVTGREHRDIQRYIIPIIAGAAPKDFVIALRSLMDFRYRSQAPEHNDHALDRIKKALKDFHDHKEVIITSGARVGKGNRPINNWYIPKLEFMQSVVSNIRANGSPLKFSADRTENAHITEIKDPARAGNNQNYEDQICRFLDRREKCRGFDLATSILEAGVDFGEALQDHGPNNQSDTSDMDVDLNESDIDDAPDNNNRITSTSDLLDQIHPVSNLGGSQRTKSDYFNIAKELQSGRYPHAPRPFRTFTDPIACTAFQLNRRASFKIMLVDEAAELYKISDLRPALADFLQRLRSGVKAHNVAGRRTSAHNAYLPFDSLQIWSSFRIQSKSYHRPHTPLPPRTINASPPSDKTAWTFGRYDPMVLNGDPGSQWPKCGLTGMYLFFNLRSDGILLIISMLVLRPCCCSSLSSLSCGPTAWLQCCLRHRTVPLLCSAL